MNTTTTDIRQQVTAIVLETIKNSVNEDQVVDEASLKNDLGMDSLDAEECLMDIETLFKIVITYEEKEGISTVKDLISIVEKKISEKQ